MTRIKLVCIFTSTIKLPLQHLRLHHPPIRPLLGLHLPRYLHSHHYLLHPTPTRQNILLEKPIASSEQILHDLLLLDFVAMGSEVPIKVLLFFHLADYTSSPRNLPVLI